MPSYQELQCHSYSQPTHSPHRLLACSGTGKTETVKELARQLAKQCIVFNTTEKLDVMHMRRLLTGVFWTRMAFFDMQPDRTAWCHNHPHISTFAAC